LLAEKEIGQAQKFKNIFYLTLGSGIGGAWMVDGRIFFGTHGAAGEIGHTIINIVNQKCFSLEELAANKFIKRKLGIDAVEARQRAERGDRRSQAVLDGLGRNLGIGLANIINIFDPEAIFLAGGISLAKKFIQKGIKNSLEKFVYLPPAQKTKIIFSRLGHYAGAFGATLLFSKK
jgi:glucokinase